MTSPTMSSSKSAKTVACVVAVEDARVFNPGTVYMRHAIPAYVRPFLVCLRGLAAKATLQFTAVTFNRESDGRDFRQLTPEPVETEDALLSCLAKVNFQRYPDPSRTERIPVAHLSRLLTNVSCGSSLEGAADRHMLLIIHSRLEDDTAALKLALEPLTSLTVLSPRQNDQLSELFGLVNGPGDLGQAGTQPHPKWDMVLVPNCIRLSPPVAPPQQQQQQVVSAQSPVAAVLHAGAALRPNLQLQIPKPISVLSQPTQPQSQPHLPAPGRVVWSGCLQFSKPDVCQPTTVQFVQLGTWATDWNFRYFDQPRPTATCALLKPEIALAIEQICQGARHDRIILRPASQTEVSPLLRLFESAANAPPKVALIFCDLKGPKPGPGLARCLVARFDAKLNHIVASVPPDQEKFLKDVQARFQKQQQQQPPPKQQQQVQQVQVQQVHQQQQQQQRPQLHQPSQPHVMVYMPPSSHQQQSTMISKMPAAASGSAATVYASHSGQPHATIVVNPVSGTGAPPAKMSRIESFQPTASGLRVMTLSHPSHTQPHVAMQQPQQQPQQQVTVQRIAVPVSAYPSQHQPQHLVITQQAPAYQPQHQLMQQQPF